MDVDLVGTHIGSYIVEKKLGEGGTGVVYQCRHTMIDRLVAVKVLHDDQAADPDAVARFFQEAKAAAEIGHPNIIVIIDFGRIENRPYLMMESLEGQSLDKRMRAGGLSLEDITHILEQVCSALVASHGKGIIHRDLKPANVFLCNRVFDPLFVKLLDFGTAKLTTPAPGVRRTQFGMVLGTPEYMSPEQCDGRGAIDHRSDIYSLGVMIYEMLTGTVPFDGEVRDILLGHMQRLPEPPRQRNPAIPPAWEMLCMRMLEKQKGARFQSVAEVAEALHDLAGHAVAYQGYLSARAASGHSGATEVLKVDDAVGAGSTSDGKPHVSDDGLSESTTRPTVHVDSSQFAVPSSGEWPATAPMPPPPVIAPMPPLEIHTSPHIAVEPVAHIDHSETHAAPITPTTLCANLCTDPRHAGFLATLLVRPEGHWYEVGEVCHTSGTAAPAALPHPLFVTWVDHPHDDPSLAAVVFLSLRTGWSTVVLAARRRW